MEPQWAESYSHLLRQMPEDTQMRVNSEKLKEAHLNYGRSGLYDVSGKRIAGLYDDDYPVNSIAVVSIEYGLWRWDSLFFAGLLDRLANNSNIRGVVLAFNCPGGTTSGLDTFAESIRNLDKVKPVISWVNDGYCASAAYWLASQTRAIYTSNQHCSVGSIGTFVTWMDWSKYLKAAGIEEISVYATESTEKNKIWRDADEGNLEGVQAWVDAFNQPFLATVKAGRGAKLKAEQTLKGQLHMSADALKYGLIDGVKTWYQIMELMGNDANIAQLGLPTEAPLPDTVSDPVATEEEQQPEATEEATIPLSTMNFKARLIKMFNLDSTEVNQEALDKIEKLAEETQAKLDDANKTIKAQADEIADLKAQVKELGSQAADETLTKGTSNDNPSTPAKPELEFYAKVRQKLGPHQ